MPLLNIISPILVAGLFLAIAIYNFLAIKDAKNFKEENFILYVVMAMIFFWFFLFFWTQYLNSPVARLLNFMFYLFSLTYGVKPIYRTLVFCRGEGSKEYKEFLIFHVTSIFIFTNLFFLFFFLGQATQSYLIDELIDPLFIFFPVFMLINVVRFLWKVKLFDILILIVNPLAFAVLISLLDLLHFIGYLFSSTPHIYGEKIIDPGFPINSLVFALLISLYVFVVTPSLKEYALKKAKTKSDTICRDDF
jgi:hypothetical protein